MALKDGILQAKPVLLEPIMNVEIRVPEAFMGEVNRDLNGRRGRVMGMDSQDGFQVISAQVPQSELFTYATELKSLTGGRGTFSSSLDRYDEMPSHLADKVVAEHRKETADSASH
jgi:elongation factor G